MAGYLKASDIDPSADLPSLLNFFGPEMPVTMAGLYVLDRGLGEEALLHNFANPDLPLIKAGDPVAADGGGVVIDPLNGFDTQIPETAAMTIFAVAKPTATGRSILVRGGSPGGSIGEAVALFQDNASGAQQWRFGARHATAALFQPAPSYAIDPDKWNVATGRVDASLMRPGASHEGVFAEAASSGAFVGRTVGSGTLRIGAQGGSFSTYVDPIKVLAVGIATARMSDAQIAAAIQGLRTWALHGEFTTL